MSKTVSMNCPKCESEGQINLLSLQQGGGFMCKKGCGSKFGSEESVKNTRIDLGVDNK